LLAPGGLRGASTSALTLRPPIPAFPPQILRNDGMMRPLVVTTVDRLDIVLGLMGAQVGGWGPLGGRRVRSGLQAVFEPPPHHALALNSRPLQVSANGPGLAGVLLCPSGHRQTTESKCRWVPRLAVPPTASRVGA
jgi:hypothetical protein